MKIEPIVLVSRGHTGQGNGGAGGGDRRTGILVGFGPWKTRAAEVVVMDSPIRVESIPVGTVDREWQALEGYPAHRAAATYMKSKALDPSSKAAKILKELLMFYIIEKQNGVVEEAFGKKKEAEQTFSKLDEAQRGASIIASTAEELKALSMGALVSIYNNLVGDEGTPVKGFKTKDVGVAAVFEALEAEYNPKVKAQKEREAKAAERKAGKSEGKPANGASGDYAPREGSKVARLLARLQEGSASIEDLVEASDYDAQNVRTSIGILRSKKGLSIEYDREAKQYSLA